MLGIRSDKRKWDDVSSDDSDEDSSNDDINSAVMDVMIFTGKTFPLKLKVKLSDTIGHIKTMIQRKERILTNQQVLILDDTVLEDNDILADFNIKNNYSHLTLMCKSMGLMRIFVKKTSPNPVFENTFSLEVKTSDTIDNVKHKIYSNQGYPVEEQVLIYNETVLDDSGTLADFHIKRDFTLTLLKSGGWINISIKTSTLGTISHRVKPTFTVSKLKDKIQSRVRIPANEQTLIFNDMVLEDNSTLADFYIGRDDTLTVMRKSSGSMEIFIETMTSKMITMNVKPSHTVGKLKSAIERNEGIPLAKQRLIFNGRYLENDSTLAKYLITKESRLHLMVSVP